ncbi:transmembrane protein adipocyte-associated 1 homolog isoform X2 [Vespa mandarinia]|uniref:transmembrane protein adipocyte-associated 1 homolog isoform X2 n=1 Tax=Vespa mandarinia TaxID=7446 RepID=UPI0016106E0E|nr:transmembrane protein adipocyte-associated 1 homolog isoform X2 [Vespa mandarinia]XP_035717480.1 transmembrane protein adipocyte-associated 1 homolog isoform X2 [Vespa mandarinia]XP_035717488.1 transmembrane protein adipocyte-associated 1 homolog isoform X2 [Vespa mandarinia]
MQALEWTTKIIFASLYCIKKLRIPVFFRVRIWDIIILVPNLLFLLFIAIRFNRARLKLRATSSPIFLAFYGLVICNVVISVIRCVVSMTVNAAATVGGKADKVLWVTVRFFLLSTEMSVVIFGLAFGHLDSRSSIRRVLLATSFIALAFTITQGTLELVLPDDTFHIPSRDFYVFGHGGMMFWFCSSLVFTTIYLFILILPWTRLRERLALPTRKSFYVYAGTLATMDLVQSIGAGFLTYTQNPVGLCIVDFTAAVYLTLFTPLVYHTFLSEFLGVSQPSIMFSYKAQVDDAMDEDTVSLPHQQSFSSLKTDSDYIYQVHTPSIHMPLYDPQASSTAMHRTSLYSLTSAKDSKYNTINPYESQVTLHRSFGIKNFARRFSAEKSIDDFAHYPLTKSDSVNHIQKGSLDIKFYNPMLKNDLSYKIKLGTAKSVSNLISSANTASNFIYNPRTNSSNSNLFFPTKKIHSENALTVFTSFDKESSNDLSVRKNEVTDKYFKSFSEKSLDILDSPLLGDDRSQNILNKDSCIKSKSEIRLEKDKDLESIQGRSENRLLDISDISNVKKNLISETMPFSTANIININSNVSNEKESAGLNQYLSSLTSTKCEKLIKKQSESLYTQTDSL